MEEYNKFDALASTTNFKNINTIDDDDVTFDDLNQDFLRRLKENETLGDHCLFIQNHDRDTLELSDDETTNFFLNNNTTLGWLGYFIGKHTTLGELVLHGACPRVIDVFGVETFRIGLGQNRSIRKFELSYFDFPRDNIIFHMVDLFLKNNNNLTEIVVETSEFGAGGGHLLSSMLGGCNSNTTLKYIKISENGMIVDGQLVNTILALGMHPQLEHLDLSMVEFGRSESTALATLLSNTTKQLQTLNLDGNDIDDDGVEALTGAISGSKLMELNLSRNQSITTKGWKTLSTLLEIPSSNLERLILKDNEIGNEGALVFAHSLVGNSKLKELDISDNGITTMPFSKLLCDTTSFNKTYLSNHTLENLVTTPRFMPADVMPADVMPADVMPADVQSYLTLNANSENKGQVAMKKILQDHSHFKMQPFFEWEFKVFPLMIDWLEKANACTYDFFGEKIKRTKLSITYDFVREFPMFYIETVTRKEIEVCGVLEKKLQGDEDQQAKLKDIQQRKERAMRRLW